MIRDLGGLTENNFDLLVIGGGIYGACIAYEGILRGLSVALIEKADFSSATSANSLKIIHGGLRYLQHGDIKRARESATERRILMRIAPHLVHPIPVLVPLYKNSFGGRGIATLGLKLNDLISFDRNQGIDSHKYIPPGKVISKNECLDMSAGIPDQGLIGGALFYDAQVYNSERLVLAFLQSAAKSGAVIANYVKATSFIKTNNRINGVYAQDMFSEDRFEITAETVINATGPWTNGLQACLNGHSDKTKIKLAKAINLVTKPIFNNYAIGLPSYEDYYDESAIIKRKNRLFFIVPWRGLSLIGTQYIPYQGNPDNFEITENEVLNFVHEFQSAFPAAELDEKHVYFVHGGLVPIDKIEKDTNSIQLSKNFRIYDHEIDKNPGLITVIGVKYTTTRNVAEKVIDKVFFSKGYKPPPSLSAKNPLHGGRIDDFELFIHNAIIGPPFGIKEETLRSLIYNYGFTYSEVIGDSYLEINTHVDLPDWKVILKAEIDYAIKNEMAQTLADVVFRRTELGTAGHPGDEKLKYCVEVFGTKLGWNTEKIHVELQNINNTFYRNTMLS
jgi:glycerol-3-phosphate dehydrogenase